MEWDDSMVLVLVMDTCSVGPDMLIWKPGSRSLDSFIHALTVGLGAGRISGFRVGASMPLGFGTSGLLVGFSVQTTFAWPRHGTGVDISDRGPRRAPLWRIGIGGSSGDSVLKPDVGSWIPHAPPPRKFSS